MVRELRSNGRISMVRMAGLVMLSSLAWGLVGCLPADIKVGPKEDASITGKVTYKGTPVTDARISFENPDVGAFGTEFKDGSYSIPKGSSGEFTVTITAVIPPMTMTAAPGGKTPKVEKRTDIPKKYTEATKSGLKATLKSGDNTFDVDMVD